MCFRHKMLKSGLAIAAVAVLAIVVVASYEKKWLNKWLPAKWQKEGYAACPPGPGTGWAPPYECVPGGYT